MLLQVTAYEVLDAWDCHVVLAHVTPEGRQWRQLGHDLVDGGDPDATDADKLRRVAGYLTLLAERAEAFDRATRARRA